jgi:hypothetical protein
MEDFEFDVYGLSCSAKELPSAKEPSCQDFDPDEMLLEMFAKPVPTKKNKKHKRRKKKISEPRPVYEIIDPDDDISHLTLCELYVNIFEAEEFLAQP